MKVLALTRHSREGSSSRLRFVQYVEPLRAMGIDVDLAPLLRSAYLHRYNAGMERNWGQIASDYIARIGRLLGARRYDLLWIEKELFPDLPAIGEDLLRLTSIPYVVDYDDAVFHNYDLAKGLRRLLAGKIDRVMRGATLVTCGNNYLASRAINAGATRIEVIPTVIDLERYRVKGEATPSRCLRIVWIGSPSTARYLDLVREPLRVLSRSFDLALRVIGARCLSWPDVPVEHHEWSEDTEVDLLRACDVGIMPLPDTPWERGKCGYKLIQYMACGLPVVGSGVGVNPEIIGHGDAGFIADTPDAWVDCLGRLLDNPDLRKRMGTEARAKVEERYCVQRIAPRLADMLRSTSRRGGAEGGRA